MTPSWEAGLPAAITHPPLPLRQATGIPSCRLDPKFFSIDLDKCQGLSELAEKVAKNQTVDEVVCEPECANEYKKVGRGGGWAGLEVFVKVTWTLEIQAHFVGPNCSLEFCSGRRLYPCKQATQKAACRMRYRIL